MVRLSDILKKVQRKEGEPEIKKPESEEEIKSPKEESKIKIEEISVAKAITEGMEQKEPQAKTEIAKAIKEALLDKEKIGHLYLKATDLIKTILEKFKKGESIDIEEIDKIIREIVDQLVLNNKELISLTVRNSPENYLYAHCVNVSILSIDVGLGLGYNKSRLNELGLAVFLHDIGMTKVLDLALEPRILNGEELNKIREHPKLGGELARYIEKIADVTKKIIEQEHERVNGKGYPSGLNDGEIEEFAQIIGVVDVYEALTHERPYRKAQSSHESIREILTSCGMGVFENRIIKILIGRIGIYPIGTWVELNTSEIGKVIRSNEDSPLRPVVNIFFDSEKHKIRTMKTVDLFKQHSIFIKRSLSEEELKEGID